MIDKKSSYLQYLPPILWEQEPPLPAFSLGGLLRIFEKILTGIEDDAIIQHNGHDHEAVEETIARIHRLFNPWYTPSLEFLDWLASWVDLTFPKVYDPGQGKEVPFWDDYQQRKLTAEIVQVYRKRGLKEGLSQYLDLYTVAETRPRIAIDDGCRILFVQPQQGRFAPISTLIGQGPSLQYDVVSHEGLIRPTCIALAPDGSLLIGDKGTPTAWAPIVSRGVWQILPPGRYNFVGVPSKPQRIGPAGWNLTSPVAVATDTTTPWHLYVLDDVLGPDVTALYRLASPDFAVPESLATKTELGTVLPISMAFDTNGHLLILDRGSSLSAQAQPKIIDVQIMPFTAKSHEFRGDDVIEPLSLLVLPDGNLIIGDARQQNAAVPADLVFVDRTNPDPDADWPEKRLLATVPDDQNHLIAPTAVVQRDDAHLFVVDVGLKPYRSPLGNPFIRHLANAATVYQVTFGAKPPAIGATPPVVTRITENNQLVYPTGMVVDNGTLYITDQGEYSDPTVTAGTFRVWRAVPHEFGVVVHFSNQPSTSQQERRRIIQNISDIINQEKPAHTTWAMVYAV